MTTETKTTPIDAFEHGVNAIERFLSENEMTLAMDALLHTAVHKSASRSDGYNRRWLQANDKFTLFQWRITCAACRGATP
jgi:hypothetical protein